MSVEQSFRFGLSACQRAIRQAVFFVMICVCYPINSSGQETVDTTSQGYQIGYQIGSWLPFVILAGLFIGMLSMLMRKNKDLPPDL
jgi:hypothetical protein